MKIILAGVGSLKEPEIARLFDRYARRIPHYMPFEAVSLPDVKTTKTTTPEAQREREGQAILDLCRPGDCLMLWDERGREMTSREFAQFIAAKANTLARNLLLVIGGPYGFSKAVYDRADGLLGLSRMTFTHEMARLLAAEQIYRAMTILRGEPYHHD